MQDKATRQSNIELLRIIAIMGVILLHYNNDTMGAAFALSSGLPVNHAICLIFEAFAICGVNVFVLISGYFLIDSDTRNITKVVELIFQLILFKVLIYVIDSLIYGCFTWKGFGRAFVPNNYFVIIYIALYLVSPIVNAGVKKFSDKAKSIFLLVCIILFSVWTYLGDIFNVFTNEKWQGISTITNGGNGAGYTIINFLLMYLIGAYLKLFRDKIKIRKSVLVIALLILVAIITLLSYWNVIAWYYNSPFIIAEAVVLFLLFERTDMGYKKWINSLSKATFICYLVHTSLLKYIFIEYFATANPVLLFLHMLISPALIYLVCWLFYKLYSLVFGPLFKKLSANPKMKIDFRA